MTSPFEERIYTVYQMKILHKTSEKYILKKINGEKNIHIATER